MDNDFKKQTEEKLAKSVQSLKDEFLLVRSGKASASIFDKIMVDHYGSMTNIKEVASISVPEARLIVIQPWDKNALTAIERAILSSDLSLNPNNDGKVIRINVPPLTEERRKDLVKQVKKLAEEHKISTRNARRDVLELMKKADLPEDDEKRLKEEIQKITDESIKQIDKILELKEKEIMEV